MERDLTTLRYQAASTGTGTLAVTIEELNAVQRALDAEREKVKGLEALLVGFDGQDEVIEMEKSAYYALRDRLATLQARTDHDAALRRAKAEGVRMVETYARACVHERAAQLDGFTGSSGMAGVIRGKQSEADRIVDWAYACAAQIEEGE